MVGATRVSARAGGESRISTITKFGWLTFAALLTIIGSSAALAQAAASEHASHHPAAAAAPAAATPSAAMPAAADTMAGAPQGTPAPSSPGGMMGMMKGMMSPSPGAGGAGAAAGCCGVAGGMPFYPTMMNLPVVTSKVRQALKTEAAGRLGSGIAAVLAGQRDLLRAQSSNDLVAAQAAIAVARDGLSLAESGNSALQGLNQNQPPPRIAQTWFKREMSVTPDSDMIMGGGFRDLSWLHLVAMLLLAAALLTAFLLRRARLQRIAELAQRLTPESQPPSAVAAVGAKPAEDPKVPAPAAVAPMNVAQPTTPPPVKRPWKGVLRVKAIFEETPTVKTFRLMEAASKPIPFEFLPGQYASITSEIDGKKVRRSYTISSSPTQRDYIELTVKREDHGLESRHLHDHAQTGDLLEITAPAGTFFFTGKEAEGIVLIAGGVGITPMMSVLRSLTDRSYPHEIHLIYGVRTPADLIFREECAYLARRHPNVTILSIVSSADGTDWKGPVGFITADFIAGCVDDIVKRRIHLCGPPPMMEAVKAALEELHVPRDQVKTEDFAPPKGGPVEDEPEDEPPVEVAAPTLPAPPAAGVVPPAGAAPASAQATVTFTKSGKSGNLAPDQSVLEAAEAIGVVIDFECRVGTCGRCKVPLTQGEVTMEVEDALAADEKAGGTILACQAKSAGALVVDA
jgi:ferredoxin-NADP reductase